VDEARRFIRYHREALKLQNDPEYVQTRLASDTALYRPKFKVVGFAVSLRTQYSSFV